MLEKFSKRKQPTNVQRGEDYRKKISESMKRKWEDPTYRARALKGIKSAIKKKAPNSVSRTLKKKKKKKKVVVKKKNSTQLNGQLKKKKKKKVTRIKKVSPKTIEKGEKEKDGKTLNLPKFVGKDEEERMRVSQMKDQRRDLYDLLYGEEERADLKAQQTSNGQTGNKDGVGGDDDATISDDEVDAFIDLIEDEEEDFNIDDFDPYGLDELEQSRY